MSETRNFVYFIRPVGMDGPIKIGCSRKPEERLATLSVWSPFALELIGKTPGTCEDENFLHRRFSDLHSHREWFRSSPLLRATILRILAGESFKSACETISQKAPIRNQKRSISPERKRYISYSCAIKRATHKIPFKIRLGKPHPAADIEQIMLAWCGDKAKGIAMVEPTIEQIARLDQFVADPTSHCYFTPWKPFIVAASERAA